MLTLSRFSEQLDAVSLPVEWPGHWVGSTWHITAKSSQSQQKPSFNPSSGELICEFSTDKAIVDSAITNAVAARSRLASMPLEDRIEVLRKIRRGLADYQSAAIAAMRIEGGKPQWEAVSDFESALRYLDSVTENAGTMIEELLAPTKIGLAKGKFSLHPLGVAAVYLPFSTPATSFVVAVCAAAVAACPLVIVCSTHASLCGILFGLLDQSLDLPQGLLSIVFGSFNVFKHAVSDKRVAAIMYTGSHDHCDFIRRESRDFLGRQLVLQSGGKNAVLVHSSADIDVAVRCALYGATKATGQLCTSTSRIFVYHTLMEAFQERLVAAVSKLRIGPTDRLGPSGEPEVTMGPLYSAKAVEKFLRFQTMAHREARKTLIWGKVIENSPKGGHFVMPGVHVMEAFDPQSAYQSNVLFCPDMAIYEYQVLDEAIEKINATAATMAVSFVGDPEVLEDRRALFLAPNLLVNLPTVEIEATLPLAGRLQSGGHRFHGPGIALYLCYPQVLQHDTAAQKRFKGWP